MLVQYKWDDPALIESWNTLYEKNRYLFPYSSRAYNENIVKYRKMKPAAWLEKDYVFVYYEDKGEKVPLIIFPLTVKRGRVYLLGEHVSGAGNMDCIYDSQVTDEQFLVAFRELAEQFKGRKLELYKVNERSRLYEFLERQQEAMANLFQLQKEMDRICIKILFSDDYDDYFCRLSKNAKSNLRKAYNKIVKMEVAMHLEVLKGPIANKKLLSDLMRIYTKRESERKKREYDFLPFLKHRYVSALTWAMESMESQYTFCLWIGDRPAAFMSGFLTNFNEIVFPIISIDSDFHAYAPGKLMISESIKYLQQHSAIRGLDLSRGDERYKLEMGGIAHYNYRFFLQF